MLFDETGISDTVMLDGPYGLAYLKPKIKRDIVCVVGGSGLSLEMTIVRVAAQEKGLDDRKIGLFMAVKSLVIFARRACLRNMLRR
ncbi:MAG: hypothetical protein A6F72_01755 [Cycloclasticus sp. symbiont of Poecilosclerida sp. N]|nr:MAG: hypothetical protein A6F72_01755 [Cycloclasticus sp. symbiont of Poecilosclerida sp. N]